MIEYRRLLPKLLMQRNLPMIAVEVGCAGGSFAQELLENGIEKIYCVDNWDHIIGATGDGNFPADFHEKNYREYVSRFAGKFKDRVVTLKGMSSRMHRFIPDYSLGLAYFDGGHQYEVVAEDIWNYIPKLVDNGIMAFHDYYNEGYGVKKAVDEFANAHGLTLNTISEVSHPNNASVWLEIN